jgi:hypothetical protein
MASATADRPAKVFTFIRRIVSYADETLIRRDRRSSSCPARRRIRLRAECGARSGTGFIAGRRLDRAIRGEACVTTGEAGTGEAGNTAPGSRRI